MKTLYHNRKPDTTKKIREEFTLKNSTVFGGYNLLADFLEIINKFKDRRI
jgi:hypothetical protein